MKKIATWLAVISAIVFVIAWGIGGLMIYENNYESNAWAYVGMVAIIIFFCSLIYLKMTRCPYCGKMNETFGKYCPYCGKEIKKTVSNCEDENKKKPSLIVVILYGVLSVLWIGKAILDIVFETYNTSAFMFVISILCALLWTIPFIVYLKKYQSGDEE